MPVKFKIKVAKIGNSLRITIPKEIAEAVDLKKGNVVEVYLDDDKIIICKTLKQNTYMVTDDHFSKHARIQNLYS